MSRSEWPVATLMRDIGLAQKIVQLAQTSGVKVRNFDKPENLLKAAETDKPQLILLDFDGCEKESFEVLKVMRNDPSFSKTAAVGYVSKVKEHVRQEAEKAGCLRAYLKTEFYKQLNDLFLRYLS